MSNNLLNKTANELGSLFPLFLRHLMKIGRSEETNQLSRAHIDIMFVLELFKTLTMTELSSMLLSSKPYITLLIDKLIKLDLVQRILDPKDRRVIRIALTHRGIDFLEDYKKSNKSKIVDKLSSLGDEDIEVLYHSLQNIKTLFMKLELD